MAIADVGGRQVEYVLEGAGDLVVLSSPTWWPLDTWKLSGLPQLREEYRVLAFNHRGIGQSEGMGPSYTVGSLADDLLALMETLQLGRCHVVGYAIGGAVALAAAASQPDHFRSLVIAATGDGSSNPRRSPADHDREAIREVGYRDLIRRHALNDDYAFSPSNYANHPERAVALADALWEHAGTEDEYLKHAAARAGYNVFEYAATVRQPCLVMVGEEDTAKRGSGTPVTAARRLAEVLPAAQLFTLPGVRHMLFWEEPELAWKRVKTFLASTATP